MANKTKEIACAIVKVGEERMAGEYTIVDLSVKELSTGKFYDVSCFTHEKDFHFNKGDEVLISVTVKEWKGKSQYSCSLDKIEPSKVKATTNNVPAEVWEAKDKRMCRMNALSHAVEIVKMGGNYLTDPKLTDHDIRNLVEMQAEQLVEWIYNGKINELGAPPETE